MFERTYQANIHSFSLNAFTGFDNGKTNSETFLKILSQQNNKCEKENDRLSIKQLLTREQNLSAHFPYEKNTVGCTAPLDNVKGYTPCVQG